MPVDLDELDELVERLGHAANIASHWRAVSAELKAARAVCEAVEARNAYDGESVETNTRLLNEMIEAIKNWRKSRGN